MKEIRDLRVTQIRVFSTDEIPFNELMNETTQAAFAEKYALSRTGEPWTVSAGTRIAFENGTFSDSEQTHPIHQIILEPRRVLLQLGGSSEMASSLFRSLQQDFADIDSRPGNRTYEPILASEETTCIAKLDLSAENLIDRRTLEAITRSGNERLVSHGADLNIRPYGIRFRVQYRNAPEKLTERNVTLADKELIIQVRDRTDPAEQIFETTSPTDSESHLQLIDDLERSLRE